MFKKSLALFLLMVPSVDVFGGSGDCDYTGVDTFLNNFYEDPEFRVTHSADVINYTEFYFRDMRQFNMPLTIQQVNERGFPFPKKSNGYYNHMISNSEGKCSVYVQVNVRNSHTVDFVFVPRADSFQLAKILAEMY